MRHCQLNLFNKQNAHVISETDCLCAIPTGSTSFAVTMSDQGLNWDIRKPFVLNLDLYTKAS